jgi:hypothetical protein
MTRAGGAAAKVRASVAQVADQPDMTPDEKAFGESRWVPAGAVLAFMALNVGVRVWLGQYGTFRTPWLMPTLEGLLLLTLVTSNPTSPAEHRRLRRLALCLVVILVVAALFATGFLVSDLVRGTGVSNDAGQLLAAGGLVWLGNNLAFALLYWLVDSGGPTARRRALAPVDFAFTQHLNPELGQTGWQPVFLDYVHLAFTNATAFSPTDVMPLSHRAKYSMLLQASVALALLGLVVARAVNAFT